MPNITANHAITYANWSILENPQFARVSACCYGYWDNFCNWWILLSALDNEF